MNMMIMIHWIQKVKCKVESNLHFFVRQAVVLIVDNLNQ
jgi:hypothetical protein